MRLFNLLNISTKALLRNKMRAALTMLGVVIGIASVITMISIGKSSQLNINNEISGMGTNMIMVMRSRPGPGVNTGITEIKTLRYSDCKAISSQAKYVECVSPYVASSGQAIRGSKNWPTSVSGVDPCYINIRKYKIAQGTFITDEHVATYAKVCVIGSTVAEKLFDDGENPIGAEIRFGKIPFKVIGILASKGQNNMGQDQDDIIIAPYTTIQKRIAAIDYLHNIFISAKSEDLVSKATDEVTAILRAQHHIAEGKEDDFDVFTQAEMLEMLTSVLGFISILLAAIASISLVVGGIGIMNIMYVTVTERTKEIGLRMSIGARSRDIMLQFLAESTMLSIIGGVIGVILGLSISYIVAFALAWPFVVSTFSIVISFLVCAATGIFFGWYPAKKAANLDPINALRYE